MCIRGSSWVPTAYRHYALGRNKLGQDGCVYKMCVCLFRCGNQPPCKVIISSRHLLAQPPCKEWNTWHGITFAPELVCLLGSAGSYYSMRFFLQLWCLVCGVSLYCITCVLSRGCVCRNRNPLFVFLRIESRKVQAYVFVSRAEKVKESSCLPKPLPVLPLSSQASYLYFKYKI